jgi:hypothetical protein
LNVCILTINGNTKVSAGNKEFLLGILSLGISLTELWNILFDEFIIVSSIFNFFIDEWDKWRSLEPCSFIFGEKYWEIIKTWLNFPMVEER